jgi:hypothetical protein
LEFLANHTIHITIADTRVVTPMVITIFLSDRNVDLLTVLSQGSPLSPTRTTPAQSPEAMR